MMIVKLLLSVTLNPFGAPCWPTSRSAWQERRSAEESGWPARGKNHQNVSESSESFSVVPSLEGPEGFLGLRGPRGPAATPLPPWWGSCLSREPGEGAPELQGEQKGIMVARMRARQSATSLLGVQARAGVRPEAERQRRSREEEEEEEGDREMWRKRGRRSRRQRWSSIPLVSSQLTGGAKRRENTEDRNDSQSGLDWGTTKGFNSQPGMQVID